MSATTGDTVILGAGIIGLSTAYYLSQSGNTKADSIHVVDSSPELFYCSSGLAGGFLAADWFAPSNASLGALSFALHKSLAEKHNGRDRWGYCLSTSISLSLDSEAAVGGSGEDWLADGTSRAQASSLQSSKNGQEPGWLNRVQDASLEVISREGSVAQIDPLRFCRWLLERCVERGVRVHNPARAISMSRDEDGLLNGVRITEKGEEIEIPCARILLAAGAWTPGLFTTLFPKSRTQISISPLAGHSLLVRNPLVSEPSGSGDQSSDKEVCHAVFATDTLGFSPEWFSRLGGELYLAGLNSTMIPLPELATDTKIEAECEPMEKMKACAKEMIKVAGGSDVEVLRGALCFRPVTPNGRPLVCRIPDAQLGGLKTRGAGEGGVFIASGHGAWGISQAPGTGLVMAELMEGRKTSAHISALELPV